jgi:uncharacterized membrane protein YbhN (UPF0104 family)
MRRILSFAAQVVVTLALLYFALGRANFSVLGERLANLHPGWIVAAAAVIGLQLLLIAYRWHEIARRCGAPLPLPRAVRFSLIGFFFNQVLPSTVGGDAVRIWLFARNGGGWGKATHSVLLDRFAGVFALAILVVVCLPWSLALMRDPAGKAALVLLGFGSIGACLAFLALSLDVARPLDRWRVTHHLRRMALIARGILSSPGLAGRVAVLSLFVHVLTGAVGWCVARAVAAPVDFLHALLLVPPVMLIITVPISISGWGVRESALVLAFAYAGLSESDGLLVSLLFGAVTFGVGLAAGIAWLGIGEPLRAVLAARANAPRPS